MKFEKFWKEFSFFTNPDVRYSGKPTTFDFSFPIYRAREWNGFELIRENLQYPSIMDCRKIGRANIPYHPVFYGSYSSECSVSECSVSECSVKEIKLKKKKQYALSTWVWKEDFKINAHVLSTRQKEYESALKSFNIMNNQEYDEQIIERHKNTGPGTLVGEMLETMEGIADLFLNEDDYFGSALIGFEELYRTRIDKSHPSTDVIIYPSSKFKNGINLAIHPEIVDQYLELSEFKII